MENVVYLVIFVALAATAYGRFVATRNATLLADAERGHNLLENLILALVSFLCLVMTAEVFLHWEAWLTPVNAFWSMIPATLWSGGMLIARRHPLDRTSVGTGLATLLPHAYQMIFAETQVLSVTVAALLVGSACFVAVRRESGTQP
jgi:hypothetical protein